MSIIYVYSTRPIINYRQSKANTHLWGKINSHVDHYVYSTKPIINRGSKANIHIRAISTVMLIIYVYSTRLVINKRSKGQDLLLLLLTEQKARQIYGAISTVMWIICHTVCPEWQKLEKIPKSGPRDLCTHPRLWCVHRSHAGRVQ